MRRIIILVAFLGLARTQKTKQRYYQECARSNLDIYFIVDVSSVIGTDNVDHVKNYIMSMTDKLRIGPSRNRISITTFGSTITNLGTLQKLRYRSRVRSTIRSIIPQPGRRINPLDAIEYVADNSFTIKHGLRNDRKPVCVVILSTRFSGNVTAAGLKLQERCKVVAIGAGALVTPPSVAFGVRPTSFSVRWDTQPSIQSYIATLRAISGDRKIFQKLPEIPANQLSVTFTSLQEATTYIVNVWAKAIDGSESSKSRVIVTTSLPTPVIEIDQSSITTSSVYVSWGKTTDLMSNYYITVEEAGNSTTLPEDVRGHPVAGTNHVITELNAGTRYKVTVATLSGGIRSQESEPSFFVTVPNPPVLRVRQVQHNAIYFHWNQVKGGLMYNLIFRGVETNEQRSFVNYTGTSLVMRDLTPSKRYELRGRSVGQNGVRSSESKRLRVITAPSNPDDVAIVRRSTTSLTVRWKPQPAATGYRISVTSGRDSKYRANANLTRTHFTATGMQPGTFYTVQVVSVGLNGLVDFNVVVPLNAQTVPSVPISVGVARLTSTTASVRWLPVHGVRRYIVFSQAVDGLEPTGNVSQTFNRSINSATVENLKPGTLYDFKVIGEGIQGQRSDPSQSTRDSTFAAVPAKPIVVSVDGVSITISIIPAEGAMRYILDINTLYESNRRQIGFQRRREFDGKSAVTIDNLQRGVWYSIAIKSKNVFGKVNTVSSELLLEQTIPAPPHDVRVLRADVTSLLVQWTKSTGAVSYILHAQNKDFTQEFATEDTQYHVISLDPGTKYQFRVQSVGHSERTSEVSRTITRQTIPGTPQNVLKSDVTTTSVTLEWGRTKGAASYHVVAVSLDGNENFDYNTTKGPRIMASGLHPGSWYNFTVFSRDPLRQRNDEGSDAIVVQTAPLAPRNVEVVRPSVHSYKVTWNKVVGASLYRVRAITTDDDVTTKERIVRVPGATECLVDGLDAGTRYRFYVNAIGGQRQMGPRSKRVSDVTLPATPEQATLIRVTTKKLAIRWNQVKGADQFAVNVMQTIPSNATTWELMAGTNRRVVRGLVPGGWYNISVYSIGAKNRRNEEGSEHLREQTVPLPPKAIELRDITSTNVTLKWDKVIGAAAYSVTIKNLEDQTHLSELKTLGQEAVVKNLFPGTSYSFQVSSIGEDDERRSAKSSPTREETNPGTPDPSTIHAVKANSLRLSWNELKGARSYVVRVTSPALREPQEVPVTVNMALINGLEAGTLYHFSTFSVGVTNRRNPKGSRITSAYTAPSPPSNVTTSEAHTDRIGLTWNNVFGATSYVVSVRRYYPFRESTGPEKTIPTAQTRLVVDELRPGTEYIFDIRAIGREERISEAHPEYRDASLPDVPHTPAVAVVTETSITMKWESPEGALSYQVFVEREDGEATEYSTSQTRFTADDLIAGSRYSFSLRSVGPRGRLSDSLSNVVTQQTITAPPSGLSSTSFQVDSIGLSWNDVIGASLYSLAVTSEENDDIEMTYNMTSGTVTGLRSGTRYIFNLYSVGDDDVKSTRSSRIVDYTLPASPTAIRVDDVTSESLGLSWPSVKGALSYQVEVEGANDEMRSVFSNRSTAKINHLIPGAYYDVKVFSIGRSNRRNNRSSAVTTVQTSPSPPLFQVGTVTNHSITISWVHVTGASSYKFTIGLTDSNEDPIILQTDDTTLIIRPLLSGLEYQISGRSIGRQEHRESDPHLLVDSTLPNPPDVIQGGIVTSTSIEISWDRKQGATAYLVAVDNASDGLKTDNNRITLKNLEPGRFYRFQVHSVGAGRRISSEGSPMLRVQTAPSPVNNFTVVDESIKTITLEWTDVVGRSAFEVFVTSPSNPDLRMVVASSDTRAVVTGLSPGVVYSFQLHTIGQQMQRTTGDSVTFGTTYPTRPRLLEEVSSSTTSIEIQWRPGKGALSYEIVVNNSALEEPIFMTTDNTSIRVTGLDPGQVYSFAVFSIGPGGRKNQRGSDELLVQTVPQRPSGFEVTDYTTTSVLLSWQDVVGRSSFDVIVMSLGDDMVKSLSTKETNIAVSGLDAGVEYRFQIYTNGSLTQKSSSPAFLQHSTLPGSPNRPVVTDVTTMSISITWNQVLGAAQYSVLSRRVGGADNDVIHDVASTSSTIDDLIAGATYEFVVYSIGVTGRRNDRGSPSLTKQTVTLPPTGVLVNDVSTTTLSVSWGNVYGASSYNVMVHKVTNNERTLVSATFVPMTSFTVTSLDQGTEYRIQVTSAGKNGVQSESSGEVVTATLPSAVENISIVTIATTGIVMQWTPAQGAANYVVVVTNIDQGTESTIDTTDPYVRANGLMPGTFYKFNVISMGALFFTNTNSDVEMTRQTIPVPTTFIEVSDITTTSFSLDWDASYGADSYIVTMTPSRRNDDVVRTFPSNMSSLTVNNLQSGTEYEITIISVGRESQRSHESNPIRRTTLPETPSELQHTDVTMTSARLRWNEVKGVLNYLIYYGVDNSSTVPDVIETSSNELTVESLESGLRYHFVVFSVGTLNRKNDKGSDVLYLQTVPSPPESLDISDVTTTSVIVTWEAAIGADSYKLSYMAEGSNRSDVVTTSSTSHEVTGLATGTTYTFQVRSVGDFGQLSDVSDAVTDTTVPATPDNVKIDNTRTATIALSWDSQRGATSYKISIRNLANNETELETSSTPRAVVTELVPGTAYQFVIYSIGADSRINPDGSQPITKQTVPSAPRNILVSGVNTSSLSVTWQTVIGAQSYVVTATSSDRNAIIPSPIVTSHTTALFTGLSSGAGYSFLVTAVGEDGGRGEPGQSTTQVVMPERPDLPSVIEVTIDHIALEWPQVKGAVGYQVIITSDDAHEGLQEIRKVEPSVQAESLTPGTRYRFVVYSIADDGTINPEGSEPLLQQTVALPPTGVTIDDVTTTSLSLSWDAAVGANWYSVIVHEVNRGELSLIKRAPVNVTSSAATSLIVTSLKPGMEYNVKVRSVGDDGTQSEDSSDLNTATLPASVTNLSILNVGTHDVEVGWHEAKGSLRYLLVATNIDDGTETRLGTDELFITATGLRPGRLYSFSIVSIGVLSFNNTNSDVVAIVQTVPMPPSSVAISRATTSSFVVTWSQSYGAGSYIVRLTSSVGDDVVQNVPFNMTSWTVKNLQHGTEYDVTIVTVGRDLQKSVESDVISETTLPETTSELHVSEVTSTSVKLQWNEIRGAIYYQVHYKVDGLSSDYDVRETILPMALVDDLEPGVTYMFTVFSIGIRERRNEKSSEMLYVQTVPTAPTALQIDDVTTNSVLVAWSASTGAQHYVVTMTSGDREAIIPFPVTTSQSSVALEGLSSGTHYDVTVVAVNRAGQGSAGSEQIVITTLPATPEQPQVTDVQTNKISLHWPPVKGAVGYNVVLKDVATDQTQSFAKESNKATFLSLEPGTIYEVVVFAVGSSGVNDVKSESISSQTVPLAPSGVEVSSSIYLPTSLIVSWKPVKRAAVYEVDVTAFDGDAFTPSLMRTPDTALVIENLSYGTTYDITVTSVGEQGQKGVPSNIVQRTTAPNVVEEVSVVLATSTFASLTWTPVKGAIAYVIIATNVDTNEVSETRTTSPAALITSLEPGTVYEFIVHSVGVNGVNPDGSKIARKQTVPSSPTNVVISALNLSSNSISLSWDPVKGASSYEVMYGEAGKRLKATVTSHTTFVTVSDLFPGTAYGFRVVAIGEGKQRSNGSGVTIAATKPVAVRYLRLVAIATESARLRWRKTNGTQRYRVVFENQEDDITRSLETAKRFVKLTALRPGTEYIVNVISIGDLNVTNSKKLNKRFRTAPDPPRVFEATTVDTDSVQLLWSPSRGASVYVVTLAWREEGVSQERTIESNSTSVVVSNLLPGTNYQFTVKSKAASGAESKPSHVVEETTRLDVVTNLIAREISTTSATIQWRRSQGADRYVVHYKVRHSLNESLKIASEATEVTINDLHPGEWYEFVVYVIDFEGTKSEKGSDVLHLQTVPFPPLSLTVDDVRSRSLILAWNDVIGAQSYRVRVAPIDEGSPDVVLTSNESKLQVKRLMPGTKYQFYVTSVGDENQESVESNSATETTAPAAPGKPRVSSKTINSARIAWNQMKGAIGYLVQVESVHLPETFRHHSNVSTMSLNGLVPGSWYDVSVTSIGVKDRVSDSESDQLQFQTVPFPPKLVRSSSVGTTQLRMEWEEVLGASSYVIRIQSANITDTQVTSGTNSATIKNLSPGTTYRFRLTSIGEEDQKSEESDVVIETTISDSPTNVRVSSLSSTRSNLTWSATKGAIGYVINMRSNTTGSNFIMNVSTNAATVSNLTPGRWYGVKVRSKGVGERINPVPSKEIWLQTATLPPSGLKAKSLLPRSFIISWAPPYGANQYEVTVLQDGTFITNKVTKKRQFLTTGLEPGTMYAVAVTAMNAYGMKSEKSVMFQHTVPLPPRSIDVTSVRPNLFNLTIRGAHGATAYDVITKRLNRPRSPPTSTIFRNNVGVVRNLVPGTRYRISVFSLTEGNLRSINNISIVQRTRLDAPRNVFATSNNETKIELTWDRVKGARFYSVYVHDRSDHARKSNGRAGNERKIMRLKTPSIVVNNLRPRTNYSFEVVASAWGGMKSDRSASVTSQTYALSPELPRTTEPLVVVSRVTQRNFLANWRRIKHAVGYVIVVRSSTTKQEVFVRGFSTTQLTVGQLSPDTHYDVTLKAVGVIGDETQESSPPTRARTRPLVPDRPSNVVVIKIRSTHIEMEWTPSRRAVYYVVRILNVGSGQRRRITNIRRPRVNVTGLVLHNNYTFRVAAVGDFERSPFSRAVSAQTRHPIPVIPRDSTSSMTISDVKHDSMSIKVTPIEHADRYVIILRRRGFPLRRIQVASASTPVEVDDLEQNTDYDVTLKGIGRGGEMTEESDVMTERTLRLLPGPPVDFQVLEITSSRVTVHWLPAEHALTYRVRAENMKTGVTHVYNNATVPFHIKNLKYRNTYSISAASRGLHFDSEYTKPVSVDIPYPEAVAVGGITGDLPSPNGFRLKWLPAPYAISYTVVVAEGAKVVQEIRWIRTISYRLTKLKPKTAYNVTVRAVSHDGRTTSEGKWVTVRTGGRSVTEIRHARPTPPTDDKMLESMTEAFVSLLQNPPRFVLRNLSFLRRRPRERRKVQKFKKSIQDSLQQLSAAIHDALASRLPWSQGVPTSPSHFEDPGISRKEAFARILESTNELRNLKRSNDATEAAADVIAIRLTQAMTVMMTSSTSELSRVYELLFTFMHHHVNDVRTSENSPIVIDAGPSVVRQPLLTVIVDNRTISSTGFKLTWGGHQNTHRYKVTINRVLSDRESRVVFDDVRPGRSLIVSQLEPATFYDVTVRPVQGNNTVKRGLLGRVRIRTKDSADESFQVKVDVLSYNYVTLAWRKFPVGIRDVLFTIVRKGAVKAHQRFYVTAAHTSVTFSSLLRGAEYDITARSSLSNALFNTRVKTLSGTSTPSKPEAQLSDSLVPPKGLHVVSSTPRTVAVEWFPVRLRGRSSAGLRYNVRVFGAGSSTLRQFARYQRRESAVITRLSPRQYDITVSTYNIFTRKESLQSPRLRIDLRDATY